MPFRRQPLSEVAAGSGSIPPVTATSVDRWILGVRRRQRWQRAARLAAPWLAALLVVWGSAFVVTGALGAEPPAAVRILPFVCLGLAAVVVAVAVWPRRTPWRRIDETLGLGGRLETWVDASGPASEPMRGWLQRELTAAIPSAAAGERMRKLGWLPTRPLRSALVLLALLYLLGLVLPPLPDGVLPLGAGASGGGAVGGGAEKEPATEVVAAATPEVAESEVPRAAEPEPEPEPAPSSLPPETLIDAMATRDAIVVPSFVGEGEGTLTEVDVVDVQGGEGGSDGATRVGGRAQGVGDGGDPDPRLPDQPDFERAAERALRSRHVPPAERAFVRRWFEIERGGRR